jgi:hypothetical protein
VETVAAKYRPARLGFAQEVQDRGGGGVTATYYRGEWSSIVGMGVFRKRADQPNDFLIISVILPKEEATELADRIVEMLSKSEQPATEQGGIDGKN